VSWVPLCLALPRVKRLCIHPCRIGDTMIGFCGWQLDTQLNSLGYFFERCIFHSNHPIIQTISQFCPNLSSRVIRQWASCSWRHRPELQNSVVVCVNSYYGVELLGTLILLHFRFWVFENFFLFFKEKDQDLLQYPFEILSSIFWHPINWVFLMVIWIYYVLIFVAGRLSE
jgi:hypothetical protein